MKAICGHCEALNNAAARYCRSCGREFVEAGVEVPATADPIPAPRSAAGVSTGLYDQEATRSGRSIGVLVGVGVAVVAVLGAGLAFIASQGDGDDAGDAAPPVTLAVPAPDAPTASTAAPTSVAATVAPTTMPPTTVPSTTVAPTTAPPTTVPPTTAPPTTAPPTTVPPTTAPPETAPPTTVANIWDAPTLPSSPLPTSGPGTPLIESARLRSGVLAVDVLPFLLNAQQLVDAYAAADWARVRDLDPATAGSDAELDANFASLDRASLILLDSGISGGSYEMAIAEVLYNDAEMKTAVRCIQYVANGTTGRVSRRGGFPITTLDGNVPPEAVRLDEGTFSEVTARCRFATLADALTG